MFSRRSDRLQDKKTQRRTKSLRTIRAIRPDLESLEGRRLLTTVSEYPLQTTGAPTNYVTTGPDNNLWFTEASDNIGRYNPTTKAVTQFPIPSAGSDPGPIIKASDGNLWFIERALNQFGVVNPSTGVITEVPILPDGASKIQDLVAGPDNNIWFTEYQTNKIGEINPTTDAIEEFSVPTSFSDPYDIVAADGNLWFTEAGANQIGMINPTTHTITPFTIPSSGNDEAEGIALGSDGNLWFTETQANAIGKFNLTTDAFTSYTSGLRTGAGLAEITPGPDGRLWFTESTTHNIGAINPNTGIITEYPATNDQYLYPLGITSGPDGNLYFGLPGQDAAGLGEITTSGTDSAIGVTLTNSVVPGRITAGQDGNLWFVGTTGPDSGEDGEIGVVNPVSHESTEYPVSNTQYHPLDIALDTADGSLWFTDLGPGNSIIGYNGPDKIGTINPTTRILTEHSLQTSNSVGIAGITYDQSAFYFAESGSNAIGTINPTTNSIGCNYRLRSSLHRYRCLKINALWY
jgi:virginiamycin B lyase